MVLRPYGLQTVRGPEQASSRGTQMAHRCSSLCTVNLFEGDRGGQGQEGEAGQEGRQEGQVDPPHATSSDGLWTKHQGPSCCLPVEISRGPTLRRGAETWASRSPDAPPTLAPW